MVCLVVNEPAERFRKSYGKRMTESFGKVDGIVSIQVNENQEKTNVIMGRKYLTVWGKEHIEDIIGNMRYLISGESFYQVNAEQTVILYKKVLEFAGLKEGGCVWDLYCGIGTISLFLAAAVGESGEVVGVEIVRKAIEDAKRNAALNGIKNVRFICGAAEDIGKTRRADVVVVDPPRKGCDEEVLKVIGEVKAQKVVYVSCNPGTLGRDVKILGEMGYDVKKVQGVDMFPWTGHVEIVVLLTTANR